MHRLTLASFSQLCLLVLAAAACLALAPQPALAGDWDALIVRLQADGFDREQLDALFSRPDAQFDPTAMGHKMLTLYRVKYGSNVVRRIQTRLAELGYDPGPVDGFAGFRTRWAIKMFQRLHNLPQDGMTSDALTRLLAGSPQRAPEGLTAPEKPASSGPAVYTSILTPRRLAEARAFFLEHQELLAQVHETYGVPEDIAVALLTVETRLGTFLGEDNAFTTLASMAACDQLSDISAAMAEETPTSSERQWLTTRMAEKAEWAYEELKALLTYCNDNNLDPLTMPGSIYGAVGICQFMPSSALRWGVDGDQDGTINLFDVADALHSMANYLNEHGWDDSNDSSRRQALYRYNHSHAYVNTIMALAEHLRATGTIHGG